MLRFDFVIEPLQYLFNQTKQNTATDEVDIVLASLDESTLLGESELRISPDLSDNVQRHNLSSPLSNEPSTLSTSTNKST
jgi:hypothetical protein